MKEILLSKGYVAIVDDEDFDFLNQWKWQARFNKTSNSYYASRYEGGRNNRKYIAMHRVVMNAPANMQVDHIHHNTLDNRKKELRLVTKSQNQMNSRINCKNKTGYKGVSWHKSDKKFVAQIKINGKRIWLGGFDLLEDAAEAYRIFSEKLFGRYKNNDASSPPPPLGALKTARGVARTHEHAR